MPIHGPEPVALPSESDEELGEDQDEEWKAAPSVTLRDIILRHGAEGNTTQFEIDLLGAFSFSFFSLLPLFLFLVLYASAEVMYPR